jgi:hypothetical protein
MVPVMRKRGAGKPVAEKENDDGVPAPIVVVEGLVITGGAATRIVRVWDT